MNDLYQRLTEGHQFLPFDCGDKDLNEFLEKDAMNYQRGLFAVTYFVDNGEDTIIYFSLSNDKLSSVELTKNAWRKIKGSVPHEKHRKDYPAVKIGRFAVSEKYQATSPTRTTPRAREHTQCTSTSRSCCRNSPPPTPTTDKETLIINNLKKQKIMRKKTILLSMLLPLAALIAACSGQEEDIANQQPQQPGQTELRPMTFRASDGTATRAEIPANYKQLDGENYPVFMSAQVMKSGESTWSQDLNWFENNKHLEWDGSKYLAGGKFWPLDGKVRFVAFASKDSEYKDEKIPRLSDNVYGEFKEDNYEIRFVNQFSGRDNVLYCVTDELTMPVQEDPNLLFNHAMTKLVFWTKDEKVFEGKPYEVDINEIIFEDELKWNGTLKIDMNSKEAKWSIDEEKATTKTIKTSENNTIVKEDKKTEAGYDFLDEAFLIPDQTITTLMFKYDVKLEVSSDSTYQKKGELMYVPLDFPIQLTRGMKRVIKLNLTGFVESSIPVIDDINVIGIYDPNGTIKNYTEKDTVNVFK